jgi:short-subunit dehydrogenase
LEEIYNYMNILIVGATSGIGRALAEDYINAGHHVAITGRRKEKLDEIKSKFPSIVPFVHDIRNLEDAQKIIDQTHEKFGNIDLIIISAGIGKFNKELDWDICESVLKTNVIGVTRMLIESYRFFQKQKQGHLVNISSVAAHIGNGMNPSYNASKAYQSNFLEALWMKSKKTNKAKITITDIRPGFVDTRLAQGETFWKVDVKTASKSIQKAISRKKRVAYITPRWGIVAVILKWMPRSLAVKLF